LFYCTALLAMSEVSSNKPKIEEKKDALAATASIDNAKEVQTDLWNQLLADAQTKESIPQKHVLLLGNINSGKSSLLHALQGNDTTDRAKPVALDYTYIDVFGDDTDEFPITRIHVWQTEGDPDHRDLLKFAQNQQNFEHSCAVIVLDFSRPWDLVTSLTTWLDVLRQHLQSLNIPQDKLNVSKQKLMLYIHQWPETEGKKKTSLSSKNTALNVEQSPPTLPEGTLSENLGIPIVVVCTKVDTIETLVKDFGYKDAHFEYIQQYLRRICLKYGAALVYTSVKKNINIELLLQYLQHLLFGLDFHHKPQLLQKDAVFVPIGWDSLQKIEVDFQSQKLCIDPNVDFREVITVPLVFQKRKETTSDVDVVTAEDDQIFLQRLYESVASEMSGGVTSTSSQLLSPENDSTLDMKGKIAANTTSNIAASLLGSTTPLNIESVKKITSSPTASTIPSTPPTSNTYPREDLLESFKKLSLLNRQTTSPLSSTGSLLESLSRRGSTTTLPTSPKSEDEMKPKIDTSDQQVLANFFNSLINKKKPVSTALSLVTLPNTVDSKNQTTPQKIGTLSSPRTSPTNAASSSLESPQTK
jgi:dynein light intermediate chain 1